MGLQRWPSLVSLEPGPLGFHCPRARCGPCSGQASPARCFRHPPRRQETTEKKQGCYLIHLPCPHPPPRTPESRQRKPTGNPISQLPSFVESTGGVATPNWRWWVERQGGDGEITREEVVMLLYKRYEPPLVRLIDFLLYCSLKPKA